MARLGKHSHTLLLAFAPLDCQSRVFGGDWQRPESPEARIVACWTGASDATLDDLDALGERVSSEAGCVSLVLVNHFDLAMLYTLFIAGERVDDYVSRPEAFLGDAAADDPTAQGGDPQLLATAVGHAANAHAIAEVLRRAPDDPDAFESESERCAALLPLLGVNPTWIDTVMSEVLPESQVERATVMAPNAHTAALQSAQHVSSAEASPSPAGQPLYLGLSLYWDGAFGTHGDDWLTLAALLADALRQPAFDRMSAIAKGARRGVARRAISAAQAERIAELVRDGDAVGVLLGRREVLDGPDTLLWAASVDYERPGMWWKGQPLPQLPWELGMAVPVSSAWPSAEECDALIALIERTGASHGLVSVCLSADEAFSQAGGRPVLVFDQPRPSWADPLVRQMRYRHALGPLVRGASWGTLLSAAAVATVGGVDALRATGAHFVRELTAGRVYVQCTAAAEDAISAAGERARQALGELLLPITPSERYPPDAPRMAWELDATS